ncbi:hypothetical protein [Nostoc sp.]
MELGIGNYLEDLYNWHKYDLLLRLWLVSGGGIISCDRANQVFVE